MYHILHKFNRCDFASCFSQFSRVFVKSVCAWRYNVDVTTFTWAPPPRIQPTSFPACIIIFCSVVLTTGAHIVPIIYSVKFIDACSNRLFFAFCIVIRWDVSTISMFWNESWPRLLYYEVYFAILPSQAVPLTKMLFFQPTPECDV